MSDNMKNTRVLIVDDHPVVRHGLRSLLAGPENIEVVGEVESGEGVLAFLADNQVDLILLDIKLKGQTGIDVARILRQAHPEVKIIILTTYDDDSYLQEALEAGVHGFLLKSVSHEILPEAIQAVMEGERRISPQMVDIVVANYQKLVQEQARRKVDLKPDDLKLLSAIAEGASNKELAEQFFISEATVKRKIQEIIEKLGVSNRIQAIAEAIRRGWI